MAGAPKTIVSDEDARDLLPGGPNGLHAVLFWSPEQPRSLVAADRFRRMDWPPGCQPWLADLAAAPETARWFGVTRPPTLVMVCDGALLALEDDCERQTCERVLALARSRRGFLMHA